MNWREKFLLVFAVVAGVFFLVLGWRAMRPSLPVGLRWVPLSGSQYHRAAGTSIFRPLVSRDISAGDSVQIANGHGLLLLPDGGMLEFISGVHVTFQRLHPLDLKLEAGTFLVRPNFALRMVVDGQSFAIQNQKVVRFWKQKTTLCAAGPGLSDAQSKTLPAVRTLPALPDDPGDGATLSPAQAQVLFSHDERQQSLRLSLRYPMDEAKKLKLEEEMIYIWNYASENPISVHANPDKLALEPCEEFRTLFLFQGREIVVQNERNLIAWDEHPLDSTYEVILSQDQDGRQILQRHSLSMSRLPLSEAASSGYVQIRAFGFLPGVMRSSKIIAFQSQ